MRTYLTLLPLVAFLACSEKKPAPDTTAAAPPAAAPAPEVDATSPDSFMVHVVTSRGAFDIKVHRDWAPHGADRLYTLLNKNFYDGTRFFRVLAGFMAQFGISGDPATQKAWHDRPIPDDPPKQTNTRGILTFATAGPNTRTTQLFINYDNKNARLDADGFSGVGRVVSGMSVVDSLFSSYGEGAPNGYGPDQGQIEQKGNAYLSDKFPQLDSIVTARVTQTWPPH
jgi:peptidyl-prolyl cis-trans isomerase A (cyclophilin A)